MIVGTPNQYFQPQIQGVINDGKVEYRLVDDYGFIWVENDIVYRRIVFAKDKETNLDWQTDLASIPDSAALLGFKSCGPSDGAAILHDRGYQIFGALKLAKFPSGEFQKQQNGVWVDCDESWTRLRCDNLYRNMCIYGGMPAWKANIEFAALRIGAISKVNGWRWYFS